MSLGPIVFPDVTAVLIAGLRAGFGTLGVDAEVAARVPGTRAVGDGPLVTVRRLGGPTRDHVFQDAVMAVEAWGDEQQDAHDLIQLALAVARGMAGGQTDGVSVYRVTEDAGAAYQPDDESDQPRYTAAITVTVRGRNP